MTYALNMYIFVLLKYLKYKWRLYEIIYDINNYFVGLKEFSCENIQNNTILYKQDECTTSQTSPTGFRRVLTYRQQIIIIATL